MENPQIESTIDYSMFKQVGFNKEKNKRHIWKLKNAIQKENLLHLHPILINNLCEIIDGQHRFEAAKELGLPVFYIKSDISYDHILTSNYIQNGISLIDVIKFYSTKDKIPSYIKLYHYLKSMEVNPKCFFGLIFGGTSRSILEFIKSGKFQFPSDMQTMERLIDSYNSFKEFVKSKRITPFSMFTTSNFSIGYRNMVLSSGFNEQIFLSKLEQRWFDLKPQINSKEWTRQMIGIYNWKNHNPIENGNA